MCFAVLYIMALWMIIVLPVLNSMKTHLPPRCPWFVDVLFRFCGLIRPGLGSRITNQGYYNIIIIQL